MRLKSKMAKSKMIALTEISFGEWLKRQRNAKGLTQTQLAHQIGCAAVTLRKIEAEERRPSAQILERLAEIFNIPQDERQKFSRYARGDWQYAPSETRGEAPWRVSTTSAPSNLSSSLTSLIGRDQDMVTVREYLSNATIRLVTLIGPPGIGKTRLSLEVARTELSNFPDGVFFVALAPLEDSNLVVPTISQTLGLVEATDPSPFKRLGNGIGDKEMLLLLDNVEHLIEETATLVADLLSACPRLKILTTSREVLRVPGEWLYPVPTLSIPGETQLQAMDMETASQYTALTLFAERARAVRSDFALSIENVQAVASICRQLDGLPLAIELIAARVRLMSPQSLLSHLSGQFVLSADGMRAEHDRQKTLNNAIRWSYNLLSEEEQKVFAQLSVFVGGFTLEAMEAVAAEGDISKSQVTNLLGQLVNKSLVTVETSSGNVEGQTRYGMLETIRAYAREKLDESGGASMVRDRHAEFFAQITEEADSNAFLIQSNMLSNKIESELDNIRAAINWSIKNDNAFTVFRLLAPLNFLILSLGGRGEVREKYDQALALKSGMARTAVRAKALNGLGFLPWADEYSAQQQQSRLEEALSIGREVEDKSIIAKSLWNLGFFEITRGAFEKSRELLMQSLDIYRELGTSTKIEQGFVLGLLGDIAFSQNDLDQAAAIFTEDIIILREIDNKKLLGYPIRRLGQLVSRQGHDEEAILLFKESIILNQQVGDQFGLIASIAALAGIHLSFERAEVAARLLGAIDAYLREMNMRLMPIDQQEYEHHLALLYSLLNQPSLERAWTKGRAMTVEQAVTFALENSDE